MKVARGLSCEIHHALTACPSTSLCRLLPPNGVCSIPVLMTFFAVQQELRLNFTDPAVIRYGKVGEFDYYMYVVLWYH